MKKSVLLAFVFSLNILFAVTCDEILQDSDLYFNKTNKDDFSYLNSDFNCKNSLLNLEFLKNLYKLSIKIRNENIDCIGNEAIINEKKFQEKLLFIALYPKKYENEIEKNLNEIENKNLQILKKYSYESIENFIIYEKFINEFNNNKSALESHFANLKDININLLTKGILNEYLKFAVANKDENLEIFPLQDELENRNLEKIHNILYQNKLSQIQLNKALNIALLNNCNTDILRVLIDYGANVNYGFENSVFFALKNLENLKFLVQNGANVNYKNIFGKTPLFVAVENGDLEIIDFLIYNGASVNTKFISNAEKMAISSRENICYFNEPLKTLLMFSAEHSTKDIVELLVKHSADEFKLDEFGLNALDYAIFADKNETINYLKSLGLKQNAMYENE